MIHESKKQPKLHKTFLFARHSKALWPLNQRALFHLRKGSILHTGSVSLEFSDWTPRQAVYANSYEGTT